MEGLLACRHEFLFDLETAGSEDDGEGEPEAAVGGERGGTEGVADSHLPTSRCQRWIQREHKVCRATHHMPASN